MTVTVWRYKCLCLTWASAILSFGWFERQGHPSTTLLHCSTTIFHCTTTPIYPLNIILHPFHVRASPMHTLWQPSRYLEGCQSVCIGDTTPAMFQWSRKKCGLLALGPPSPLTFVYPPLPSYQKYPLLPLHFNISSPHSIILPSSHSPSPSPPLENKVVSLFLSSNIPYIPIFSPCPAHSYTPLSFI